LNILSWSSTNVLAVALSQCVYLWDAATSDIKELMNVDATPGDYISSVSFIQEGGSHLAIGTASNMVQLWDVQAGRSVRSMDGHSARVGALAWNNHLLASGSKDNTIVLHDVRIQNHIVGKMSKHTQEVCGLAWSPDGAYLASGANDNTLCITDAASMLTQDATPSHMLTDHQAAVKALAWSPHERNLLATGGGTADRCIKFWNAQSGALLNSIDTGSQVCALQWSPFEKELLSRYDASSNIENYSYSILFFLFTHVSFILFNLVMAMPRINFACGSTPQWLKSRNSRATPQEFCILLRLQMEAWYALVLPMRL
jgi:cell division cycle protein 20 (cofactor of APC complex)